MTRWLGSTKIEFSHDKQNALLVSSPGRASRFHLLHKVSQNGACLTVIYPSVLGGHDWPIGNIPYSTTAWRSGLWVWI